MAEYWKFILVLCAIDFVKSQGCTGEFSCNADPCLSASCPGNSQARCKIILDECGRCFAVFHVNGVDLSNADCAADALTTEPPTRTPATPPPPSTRPATDPPTQTPVPPPVIPPICPSGFPPRSCLPCQEGARCPEVSDARCENRRCRMCKAAFFGQDGSEIESCCLNGERCRNSQLRFQCRRNPCDGATCPGNPISTCRSNYCGGCKAEFYSITNEILSETDCVQFDECPPSIPQPGCMGEFPCLGRTCPNYPDAQCKLDACGGCFVVFFDGKKRLTTEDCFGCSGGTSVVEDCDDPCDGAFCPADPQARCEARRCGLCRAVFYTRNYQQVDCGESFCANGKQRFNCLQDPCQVKTCPGRSGTTCVADYCGGCNAVFYDSAGNRLSEFDCAEKEMCPGDLPVAGCIGPDECLGQKCPNFPSARCIVDGCNGCDVVFYDGARRLTSEDCNGCPSGQELVSDCKDPCQDALCVLYPTARCEPRRCGECRAAFFGLDRKEISDCCGKNSGDGCPSDKPLQSCGGTSPCDGAVCPFELKAECRPNYCGGCEAEFFLNGRKLTPEQCGNCEPVNCGIIPPCFLPSCPAYPNARCLSTTCGGPPCREWYVDENDNVVDCSGSDSSCPSNKPRQSCTVNPCDGATCFGTPGAVCRPNYCGGCEAEFFLGQRKLSDYDCIEKPDRCAPFALCPVPDGCDCAGFKNVKCVQQFCPPNQCDVAYFDENGKRIPDDKCLDAPPCEGEPPFMSCLADLCPAFTCEANKDAVCVQNRCGGCSVEFFVGRRRLSDIECVKRPDDCAAFTTCFNENEICNCPAVPNSQCVVQYCEPNTCKPLFFDQEGNSLSYEDCGLCEDGKPRVNCGIVPPCTFSFCAAYPSAKCRSSNCGVCREWFEDEDGNTVDCERKLQCNVPSLPQGTVSPNKNVVEVEETVTFTCNPGFTRSGSRRRRCLDRRGVARLSGTPAKCFDERCPSTRGSGGICVNECTTNADCGFNQICCSNGCGTSCVERQDVCPGGEVYTQCFSNPCQYQSCPLQPNARCVPNYCGGCFADFYVGDRKLGPDECTGSDPRCPDAASLPGVCGFFCQSSSDCSPNEACCRNPCGYYCYGYA